MSKRRYNIDLLRILACLAVITIHVSALDMELIKIGSYVWNVRNLFDGLSRFSVPVFVMISGMFMLDPQKTLTIKKLYTKYVLRMLALWIVWELFYAVVHFYNMKYVINASNLIPLLDEAFRGHFHLWYLPMLIGLYIMTPLFRALTEKGDKTILQYFILLFFVFTVLKAMLPLFAGAGDYIYSDFLVFVDKVLVTTTARYSGYYMLGYYLYKYPLEKRHRYILYALGIVGAALNVFISSYFSLRFSEGHGMFDFFYVSVFFMSAGLFVFFKDSLFWIELKGFAEKLVDSLSSCCFGIYLLHAFIVERIYKLGLTVPSLNPALSVPLITLSGFFVSWLIVLAYKSVLSGIKSAFFREKAYVQN